MLVGITGQIASGKSYILKIIQQLGYQCYNADLLTLEAYNDKEVKNKLNNHFQCIENDKVNKKILKNKLTNNLDNLQLLNQIIHPYIYDKIVSLDKKDQLIFIEIPLLFETNFYKLCKVNVCINIDENLRNNLLYNRNKDNYKFLKILELQQFTQQQKNELADYIINNDLNESSLKKQVNNLIDYCKKLL